tara:strand:- start:171 stop:407 length:237 start_codon:yes stop_codon:yes gene_type:complete
MLKFISYALLAGAANGQKAEYCEIKTLQSPYIESVDESAVKVDVLLPIATCQLSAANRITRDEAMAACMKNPRGWLKL